MARAVLVHETTEFQLSIAVAALKANCSRSDIVKLILGDQLNWVGRKPELLGIDSLVVDLNGVVARVRPESDRDLSFWECVEALGAGSRVVHALTRSGILPIKHAGSLGPSKLGITIPMASLRSFKDQYVSLYDASKSRSRPMHVMSRDLLRQGILPTLSADRAGATFYLRSELGVLN